MNYLILSFQIYVRQAKLLCTHRSNWSTHRSNVRTKLVGTLKKESGRGSATRASDESADLNGEPIVQNGLMWVPSASAARESTDFTFMF